MKPKKVHLAPCDSTTCPDGLAVAYIRQCFLKCVMILNEVGSLSISADGFRTDHGQSRIRICIGWRSHANIAPGEWFILVVRRLNLKPRPSPIKWPAHEHACHISTVDTAYLSRLELMLADPEPHIKSMLRSADEEAGSLLNTDLDEALDLYVRERARLVERLKELCRRGVAKDGEA